MEFHRYILPDRSSKKDLNTSFFDQKGTPITLTVASLGLLLFLVATFTLPFNKGLFSKLFTRPFSEAATNQSTDLLSNLNFSTTFNSIGIELFYSGDASASGTVDLKFKKSSDSVWRDGLALNEVSNVGDGGADAYYGSVLQADSGTPYDIQLTVKNPNGVIPNSTLSVANTNISTTNLTSQTIVNQVDANTVVITITGVKTRDDNIPAASTLTPTYFVRTDGNDSNPGTSNTPTGAWATLDKAINSAPTGAVVQLGPGHFVRSRNQRTSPITLMAQYPAVDDNRNITNQGNHTIIDAGIMADLNTGSWVKVFPDPNHASGSATPYPVYEWTGANVPQGYTVTQGAYLSCPTCTLQKLADWKPDSTNWPTPQAWVDVLYQNLTWNYGFYQDPTNSSHLYVRLPYDQDPNQYSTLFGYDVGVNLFAPNSRVSGIEFRDLEEAVFLNQASQNIVIDHNLFTDNYSGAYSLSPRGVPNTYPSDVVFEYNLITDTNMWAAKHPSPPSGSCNGDPTCNPTIPWDFIKNGVKMPNGTTIGYKPGNYDENGAYGGEGTRRLVFRYNTCTGLHDCFGQYDDTLGGNNGYDRYAGMDTDFYDNIASQGQDDVVEGEISAINWRIWDNIEKQTGTCLSTSWLFGPDYYFRNQCFRTGTQGLQRDADNWTQPGGIGFKYGTDGTTYGQPAKIYVINNTFWTDWVNPDGGGVSGGGQYFSGGSAVQRFYLRNNIFAETGYGFSYPFDEWTNPGIDWNEDYDYFYTSSSTLGMEQWTNANSDPTLALYRQHTLQGTHTNSNISDPTSSASFHTPPDLNNPTAGDLSLAANSPQIDAGVVVPNIADLAGVNYAGSAPDLGAIESGLSIPTPTPTTAPTFTPAPTSTPTITPTLTPSPLPSVSPSPSNRAFFFNSNDNLQATTSSSMTPALSLSFTPTANSTYYLLGSWVHSSSVGSQGDSTDVTDPSGSVLTESDRFGSGLYWVQGGLIDPITFGQNPGSQTYALQFSGSAGEIKDAKLAAIQADPINDHYLSSSTQVSTSQTSFQDAAPTLSFTPSFSNNYLIVATADVGSDYAATEPVVQLNIDGTSYAPAQLSLGGGIWQPFATTLQVNLSGSLSHTIKLQLHSTSTGSSYLKNIRLVAINLSTLGSSPYQANDTLSQTTSTSPQTDVSLNQAITPAHYLVLGSGVLSDNSPTDIPDIALTSSAAAIEDLNTSVLPGGSSFFGISIANLASPASFALNYHAGSSTATAGVSDGHLSLLQLDNTASISTPNPSACPSKKGDFDSDGVVNLTDLSIFAASFGTSAPNIPNPCTDLNGDGKVDLTDLSLFASSYGS